MKKIICLLSIFFLSFHLSFAQDSTCHLRISLLTASPGAELYSIFGHSAIRVYDSVSRQDIIYNYGTFDFDDPSFYTKFVRGKLLYFVSVDDFNNFMYEYQYEKRGIVEQELNLTCNEKQKLNEALIENAKEENKYYKYDFVYDNCTTRLRDIVEKNAAHSILRKNIRPYRNVTFRNLIHEYLDKGDQPWSKFGIDLLLGVPLDKKISNREAMFLPDYLFKAFDSSSIRNTPLVAGKTVLLQAPPSTEKKTLLTPFIVFGILFITILLLSFSRSRSIQKVLLIFDFLYFFILGMIGILLLFMWFGTDHLTTKQNFNLAWAFPLHFIMAFFVHKRISRVKNYFLFTTWLTIILLVSWYFLPQQLNPAALPLAGIILVRSWLIGKKDHYANKKTYLR